MNWRLALAWVIGWIAWVWRLTVRVQYLGREHLKSLRPGPVIYAIWHEQQLGAMFYARDPDCQAMVSRSKDGDFIAGALPRFGIAPVRGSSSKGGKEALQQMIEGVRAGRSATLTIDGPRGPRRIAKAGVFALSRSTGRPILPAIIVFKSALRANSWDRFEVPLPFTRGVVAFGPPFVPSGDLRQDSDELRRRLDAVERDATLALR